jgi:hypothetical protein
MKNNSLKDNLKTILDAYNVSISKGTIGGYSIEVASDGEVKDLGSFIYHNNETMRDADYDMLLSLIKK